MSLLGLGRNYRRAAKEGMSVLAMNERDREMAEERLEQEEKGQRGSMTASGAGMGAMLGLGAAKSAMAGYSAATSLAGGATTWGTGMGSAMAGAGAIAPWLLAGAGVGYLLSRIF